MMVSRELSRSLSLTKSNEYSSLLMLLECCCPCLAFIALNSSLLPNRPCGFSLATYCCCHHDWLQACPFCYYAVSHHHRQDQHSKKCPRHTRFPRRKSEKKKRKQMSKVQTFPQKVEILGKKSDFRNKKFSNYHISKYNFKNLQNSETRDSSWKIFANIWANIFLLDSFMSIS